MDLAKATQAHTNWKVKLRLAISRKETLDVHTIAADDACEFGQWLHREGRASYGTLESYRGCLKRHAAFHAEAAAVAVLINGQDYGQATAALDANTPYANASAAVGSAIAGLKKEAKL